MISKILVSLDGSSLAESGLPQAAAIARDTPVEPVLLRMLESSYGDAEHADLVVLSAHGACSTINCMDRRSHGSVAAGLIARVSAPLRVLHDPKTSQRRPTTRRAVGNQVAPSRTPFAREA